MPRPTHHPRTYLFVVFLVLFAATAPVWGQEETSLLALRALAPVKAASTLEAWNVDVDVSLLENRSPTLDVDLPDGLRHRIEGSRVDVRGPGDLAWYGRVENGGQAILTLKSGFVSGLLYTSDAVYELATSPRGQVLKRLDPGAFAPCAHEDDTIDDNPYASLPRKDAPEARDLRTKSDSLYVIDVMTVYTPAARAGAGGTAQIQATVQSAIDVSNTAFGNSQTAARFRLVHTQEVEYTETGNISAARNWLRNDPTVQQLRNVHGADVVGMLVNNGGGYCGIAFLMGNEDPAAFAPNAYQVTARTCAVGNLSYPHEHGHNMGLQHNPENGAPSSQAIYPWAFGHYVNGNYRTVLSYSNPCTQGCVRQPYFSNPDVFFQGAATGIANQRENARTINLIAPYTVEYRTPPICDLPECID